MGNRKQVPLARLEMLSLALQALTSRHTNPLPSASAARRFSRKFTA